MSARFDWQAREKQPPDNSPQPALIPLRGLPWAAFRRHRQSPKQGRTTPSVTSAQNSSTRAQINSNAPTALRAMLLLAITLRRKRA